MKPIKLADGRIIDPITRKIVEDAEPAASSTDFAPKALQKRKLEDLPASPQQMSVIYAVIGFQFSGLPDADIIVALKCSRDQFDMILKSDAYDKARNMMIESFVNGQNNAAREILASGSIGAATELVSLSKKGKKEETRVRASESILKATGVASDDVRANMQAGLRIKIVRDTPTTDITIEVGA